MIRLKNFHIVLSLLLVFCVCLSLTAQVNKTVDTSPKSPLEKAEDAYDEAVYHYNKARDAEIPAHREKKASWDTVELLLKSLERAESENSDNWGDIYNAAVSLLDLVAVDVLDIVTDAAGTVLTGIKEGWDWKQIKKKKDDIQKALILEFRNSAGTDMQELISGLRSKKEYRVRMRAKNDEGPSVETGYKTITTR